MVKNIIDQRLAQKAKQALLKLRSNGTAANKLKALIAANKNVRKLVGDWVDLQGS